MIIELLHTDDGIATGQPDQASDYPPPIPQVLSADVDEHILYQLPKDYYVVRYHCHVNIVKYLFKAFNKYGKDYASLIVH